MLGVFPVISRSSLNFLQARMGDDLKSDPWPGQENQVQYSTIHCLHGPGRMLASDSSAAPAVSLEKVSTEPGELEPPPPLPQNDKLNSPEWKSVSPSTSVGLYLVGKEVLTLFGSIFFMLSGTNVFAQNANTHLLFCKIGSPGCYPTLLGLCVVLCR